MIQGFPDAFEMFEAEDRDVPEDCHIHCMHWETKGHCCDCGDTREPIKSQLGVREQGDGFTEDEDAN